MVLVLSAGHLCELSVLFVRIQNLITILEKNLNPLTGTPPRGQNLSFRHTKFSKCNCLGSRRFPGRLTPPYGKSWIRHWNPRKIIMDPDKLHMFWKHEDLIYWNMLYLEGCMEILKGFTQKLSISPLFFLILEWGIPYGVTWHHIMSCDAKGIS